MIFIILGSQKFQFNRLLKKIDHLIENRTISGEVFAQIGYSDYKPVYYSYTDFLDRNKFTLTMEKSSIVITHGGTGAIIGAVKSGKRVIAVPRQVKYKEHVDNHQLQIIKQFESMGIICACYDIEDLAQSLGELETIQLKPYQSNTKSIIESIDTYILEN